MSYLSINVHFVWSTAEREPLIRTDWQDRLYEYLGGILRNKNALLLGVGGMADHIHLLAALPATLTIADTVNALKANSSKWIHQEIAQAKGFRWQEKYGAFSVSKSNMPSVIRYIQNQVEHHRGTTFQKELRALLKKHGIVYDEQYVWE